MIMAVTRSRSEEGADAIGGRHVPASFRLRALARSAISSSSGSPTRTEGLKMQTRPLGRTGERLSAISFGCMGLVGWYGTRDDAEARATLLAAMDRGVSHFDT